MVVIIIISMFLAGIIWSLIVIHSENKKRKLSRTFYVKTKRIILQRTILIRITTMSKDDVATIIFCIFLTLVGLLMIAIILLPFIVN